MPGSLTLSDLVQNSVLHREHGRIRYHKLGAVKSQNRLFFNFDPEKAARDVICSGYPNWPKDAATQFWAVDTPHRHEMTLPFS